MLAFAASKRFGGERRAIRDHGVPGTGLKRIFLFEPSYGARSRFCAEFHAHAPSCKVGNLPVCQAGGTSTKKGGSLSRHENGGRTRNGGGRAAPADAPTCRAASISRVWAVFLPPVTRAFRTFEAATRDAVPTSLGRMALQGGEAKPPESAAVDEGAQPPFRIRPDIPPEEGIIIDMVIVAGEHIGSHRRQCVIVADQQETAHVAARRH